MRDAGRACLEKRGFESTTVTQIVEAAGVARGTFYLYFPTKEALADELLAELNATFRDLLAPVLARAAEEPLEQTIRCCAELFLDHWRREARFIEAYMQRSQRGLDTASARDGLNEPMAHLLGDTLPRLASAGAQAPDLDWELAARSILAMWLRVGLQVLQGDGRARAGAVEVLTRLTVGAVRELLAPTSAPPEGPAA